MTLIAPRFPLTLNTAKMGTAILFLTIFSFIPVFVRDPYILHVIILSFMYAVLSSSWNFICGYTGIFTFGHQGFFGIGAYVSALLCMKLGISAWIGIMIGGFSAALLSLSIGLPCLRLRSPAYIALTSLAFAEIARIVCMNLVDLTRGELGLWGIPNLTDIHIGLWLISFAGIDRRPYYYLMLVILSISALVLYKQIHSPHGLALKAIRESQDAAESLGIPITKYKLYAFLLSSFFAGIVGAFYAHYITILTPTSIFGVGVMVEILTMALLGGLGTFVGPIVGAFLLVVGLEYLRSVGEYRFIVYGLVLIVVILFIPNGLVDKISSWRPKKMTKMENN